MKISIIIVVLLSVVRDVFSVQGLFISEVTILPEGTVPAADEDEITCTIASIEPAGSDVRFVKYIASPEEVASKPCHWMDNSTAQTFEECADAAAASESKMFLYEDQMCRVSNSLYAPTDLCAKNHSQLVYVDVDAAPDNSVQVTVDLDAAPQKLFCNYDWTVECINGRLVNVMVLNADVCADGVLELQTHEGLYHLLVQDYEIALEDNYAHCSGQGAKQCAPKDVSEYTTFLEHLLEINGSYDVDEDPISIGMNSTDSNMFYWSTNLLMPKTTDWASLPNSADGYNCVFLDDDGLNAADCTQVEYFCCMVPYYAD